MTPAGSNEWSFDPDWVTVNNGSFGACPRTVRAAQARWRERFERQPTRFLHREFPALLREAAASVASFLGARPEDLAFVGNATEGCNAVLRSLPLREGDEIVLFDQAYGAVRRTASFVAANAGARLVDVALPFPEAPPGLVLERLAAAITGRTVLAILDHITSPGALVLPLAAMVRACRARGVRVLVDGAHAPGQIPVDLASIGADWYAANLHKWLFAPAGTAILHARADAQAGLHPTSISHGVGQGFLAEFDWTGTRDVSGWLAAPEAIELHRQLGGPSLMARNAALVREGGAILAASLGTELAPGCEPGGAMALVRLPVTGSALAWRARLIEARIDAPVVALAEALWVRISAQAYNEVGITSVWR